MKELPDGAHVKAQSKLPPFTHVVFCTGHGWANRAVATRLFTTHSGWLFTTHVATRQRCRAQLIAAESLWREAQSRGEGRIYGRGGGES